MRKASTPQAIRNIEDFLAHALALEAEAATRYKQFAEQMQTHRKRDVAELFLRLSGMESEHHGKLEARAAGMVLPKLKPREYCWFDPESPESAPLDATHHLTTAHQALKIALANEERAWRYFERIAASPSSGDQVRRMAKEFAGEEEEHMEYIERMLSQAEGPPFDWQTDTDPPVAID
jgi:rubrerythrin